VVKENPLTGNPVKCRGLKHLIILVCPGMGPSPVIGNAEKDIGPLSGKDRNNRAKKECENTSCPFHQD
jgi:hypothetical protein